MDEWFFFLFRVFIEALYTPLWQHKRRTNFTFAYVIVNKICDYILN